MEDLTLEISSPGIDRKLKSNEELAIFEDRGVRVLVGDQWLAGINRGSVELASGSDSGRRRVITLPLAQSVHDEPDPVVLDRDEGGSNLGQRRSGAELAF